MRPVTLEELYQLALDAKENIWAKARGVGRDVKIYTHWSAGRGSQTFDDYHVNITSDGTLMLSTDDLSETLAHTWKRNTGAIGVTFCACYGATTNNLGEYAPTAIQIEKMAQVIAVLANALDLTIDLNRVMSHSAAADNMDGLNVHPDYGYFSTCERWDNLFLGTTESPKAPKSYYDTTSGDMVLLGKAKWYRNEWAKKTGGNFGPVE